MRCVRLLLVLFLGSLLSGLQAHASISPPKGVPELRAGSVNASGLGGRVDVSEGWRFHPGGGPGDDPGYAAPGLDDSGWKQVSTREDLSKYGFRNVYGGWYRLRAHLPPGAQNLAVALSSLGSSYEVFANGVSLGKGESGPNYLVQPSFSAYSIPAHALESSGGELVLAVRFQIPDPFLGQTPISRVFLQSQSSAGRDVSYAVAHLTFASWVLGGLGVIAGLVGLALFFALPDQKEYLAAAVAALLLAAMYGGMIWGYLHTFSQPTMWFTMLVAGLSYAALVEFVRLVAGIRRNRLLLILEFACIVCYLPLHNHYYLGYISHYVPVLTADCVLPVMLFRAWRRGNRDAGLLLLPLIAQGLDDYRQAAAEMVYSMHLGSSFPIPILFHLGSYTLLLSDVGEGAFLVGTLLFLVWRTVRIARAQARSAGELEAARTLQQVLIPETIPAVPGLEIAMAYHPAQEVGGDFFQVVRLVSGDTLVVLGDVSGKGMPAAMTVSLLIGAIRTQLEYTESPGEMLTALNRRLCGRGSGFTTCLVLRISPAGVMTVANAGHLAPYRNGVEMVTEPALPLGLDADAEYGEVAVRVEPGDRITLLTDGVPEATQKRELFGFARTATMSREPAASIAEAARTFGQTDDITVLSIQIAKPVLARA